MGLRSFFAIGAADLLSASLTEASTVYVDHDEWTLPNTGFNNAADTGTFVSNLVAEFGTTIHAYSANFGFTESSLGSAMSTAGATYTTGTSFAFNLANISIYDANMLGGYYLTATELGDLATYVANGGNVYIAGGTGIGGAAVEASAWNGFLAAFGIQMAPSYNGVGGTNPVSGDSLFAGVSALCGNNGNGLSGSSVFCCGQNGLYAVYRDDIAPVPLPASSLLPACFQPASGRCSGRTCPCASPPDLAAGFSLIEDSDSWPRPARP